MKINRKETKPTYINVDGGTEIFRGCHCKCITRFNHLLQIIKVNKHTTSNK